MDKNKKLKMRKMRRHMIQALGMLAFNGNFKGFAEGTIYTGELKKVCVPVLNCYSCPGALGACPIGSIQAVAGSHKFNFSFYVVGLLMMLGILLGRFFCGYLCPFGFLQDLLHKIPLPKIKVPKTLNRILSYLKYVILAVFVFILPLALADKFGMSDPYFCKYICPAGILEGGLPLISKNPEMRRSLGFLFNWKLGIAVFVVIGAVFIYRIFCRYLCPLGAFYGIFHPFGFYRFKINDKCIHCGRCAKACKLDIDPVKTPNSPECIRCRDCIHACPVDAIDNGFALGPKGDMVRIPCSRCQKAKDERTQTTT